MEEPSSSPDQYEYTPLPGRYSLRVFHLRPGRGDDPVKGTLETVDFRNNPQYEALSYEWGSPKRDCVAFLDGDLQFEITTSLHTALRDLRHESASDGCRTIWADAICINQDDIEERQQQVSIMGSIYRNATRVITYIGPEADNSSMGIDFAHELLEYYERSNFPPDRRLHMPNEIHHLGLPPIEDPRWAAFRKLVVRGWAGRCWCAQEYVLNEKAIMVCGRRVCEDVSLIPSVVQLAFKRALPSFTVPSSDEDPKSLRECWVIFQWMRSAVADYGAGFIMLHLMTACHPLQATDPRDKVYCLLALVKDKEDLGIRIDYSCPVEELYTYVSAAILTKYLSTDLLYSNLGIKILDLPSWVPDWSTWRFGSNGMLSPTWYQACGTTLPNFRVGASRKSLHIGGCLVDQITLLNDVTGADYLKADYPHQSAWVRKQKDLFNCLASYPGHTPLREVFWKTLICNLTLSEIEPDDDYEAYFHAFGNSQLDNAASEHDMAREYRDAVRRRLRYRRLCITQKGYFGAVPEGAQIGDWVCMFEGTRSLFVIREKRLNFTLLGSAYVHGLMNGEVLEMEGYERKIITLC